MAFNPCPCGWLTSTSRQCRCDDGLARRYAGRLSGPMRDRLDLWVRADEPRHADPDGVEPSAAVAQRIREAWQRQLERQGMANGELPATVAIPAWRSTRTCERCCSVAAPSSGSPRGGCIASPGWPAPSPTSARPTTSGQSTLTRHSITGPRWQRDRGWAHAAATGRRGRPRRSAVGHRRLAGARSRLDRPGGRSPVLDRHLAGAWCRRRRVRPHAGALRLSARRLGGRRGAARLPAATATGGSGRARTPPGDAAPPASLGRSKPGCGASGALR